MIDATENLDDGDYSRIDARVMREAQTLTDWHIDLRRPMSSVVFKISKSQAGTTEVVPEIVPESLFQMQKVLMHKLKKHEEVMGTASFTLDIKGMRFRGERIRPGRYALRIVSSTVRSLDELGLSASAIEVLTDPDYRSGGLILIAGATGAGKSTTAVAAVVDRLKKFGGYCLTLESPVECAFEGFHGAGYVEQIDASATGFKLEVATAMRKFPAEIKSIFFFGEVIEETAAAELTRLIGRGHLVITTIHAKDTIRAIEMLVSLAEGGGEKFARQLIGGNLQAVLHQQLVNRKPVVTATRINEAMKNIISNSEANLFMLSSEIDLAKRQKFNRRSSDRSAS
jgi:Tfp pilus assembly pilus retraction ATPase PilT